VSGADPAGPGPDGASHERKLGLEDDAPFDEPTERNYLDDLNRQSKLVISAYVEPGLTQVSGETRVQLERHGYFIADPKDHSPSHPVFNRAVTLRDSWGRAAAK